MSISSLWPELEQVSVADVVVDVDAPDLQPFYTYRVPPPLSGSLAVGACVHVPFGGQEKLGFVLALRSISAGDPLVPRIRDILALVEGAATFNSEQAALASWIAGRYVCDLLDAVRCIVPPLLGSRVVTTVSLAHPGAGPELAADSIPQAHLLERLRSLGGSATLAELKAASALSSFASALGALVRKGLVLERREVGRPRTVKRTVRAYALGESVNTLGGRLSEAGARILAVLAESERLGNPSVPPQQLLKEAEASASALKGLLDKGAVRVCAVERRRAPVAVPTNRTHAPTLTAGQRAATDWLGAAVSNDLPPGSPRHALLFGVTASGKTEVYLDAIARTLQTGRGAIVLVPEIALTAQVVDIFTGRFGDEVAVLHSRLSDGERHDEWRRLHSGEARIAVGARSAIFAPVINPGLIVVDEEHEASYKQESLPRYHARDVAAERARLSDSSLVLGSATPSLESWYACDQGRLRRLTMPERIESRPLPAVSLVDMREELRERRSLFSRHLEGRLRETLGSGRQAILFLNRRGYSQFVLCRDCGYVARCPNCAVSLTFHAAFIALRCHHCDYSRAAPALCPSCSSLRIRGFGLGTERVEEEALKLIPEARIARMDRDTTARKGAHAGIIGRFRRGEANLLIGTQMVAKGLDFPNVTLVGVVSADTSINMPDFRAAERTFQLLTQVAGRAGRGVDPGEVVIQTFTPDHYSLERAVEQDYPGFYAKEIDYRAELSYPPFTRFANIVCSEETAAGARDLAHSVAAACRRTVAAEVEVVGPAPAPLSKLKNRYRWHVALRAPLDSPLSDLVRSSLRLLSSQERRHVSVDIDPMSMA